MKLFKKDSVEDLILRGFPRDYIFKKIGVDIGYCGHNYKKKLSKINRFDYKLNFVKKNFSEEQIKEQILCFANGKLVSEIFDYFELYPKLQKTFTYFCKSLGYEKEISQALVINQKNGFKNGINRTYNVDNASQLDFVQKIKINNSLSKYGCEYPTQYKPFIEKTKKSNLKKYGVTSTTSIPEIKNKQIETLKKNYGVSVPLKSQAIKSKVKQTNLKKYGVDNPMKSDKVKNKLKSSLLDRYGITNPMKKKDFSERCFASRKKNGTLNTSKIEDETFMLLFEKYPNVRRNYKDPRYPFACDFYIPERDLFIELNAHWTHQPNYGWYNAKSPTHRKIKSELEAKFPDWCPMSWWTSDVEKRKTAKKNNLNYVVLWNEQDVEDWFALGCPDGHDGDGMYTWKE